MNQLEQEPPPQAVGSTQLHAQATSVAHPAKEQNQPHVQPAPKKIVRRRRRKAAQPAYEIDQALYSKLLAESGLPTTYTFEIEKTVQRCVALNATHIALQLPEGLLRYATVLADILKQLTPCLRFVSVLGDVTYGACCVDDLTAQSLQCQLLVHYGHSCLVPLQHTVLPVLYVFCEIQFDTQHLVKCLQATFDETGNRPDTLYLLGTVQFRHALVDAQEQLEQLGYTNVTIPQVKPLSKGEVLGCTSPKLDNTGVVCFVADGRFHLEATLIANPHCDFYRYDPYSKSLTIEQYDHTALHDIRKAAIVKAKDAQSFGIILGTLGRQGNPAIVRKIQTLLKEHGKSHFLMLLSEITPAKLQCFRHTTIDCWIQVACPRLSVDWGHGLCATAPVLTPYELFVCLNQQEYQDTYPMDYYSETGGPWSNYHPSNKDRQLA